MKLRRAFKTHIRILSFVDILLARRQLIVFRTKFDVQNAELAQKISDRFGSHRKCRQSRKLCPSYKVRLLLRKWR